MTFRFLAIATLVLATIAVLWGAYAAHPQVPPQGCGADWEGCRS